MADGREIDVDNASNGVAPDARADEVRMGELCVDRNTLAVGFTMFICSWLSALGGRLGIDAWRRSGSWASYSGILQIAAGNSDAVRPMAAAFSESPWLLRYFGPPRRCVYPLQPTVGESSDHVLPHWIRTPGLGSAPVALGQ
jgi:hypothetical protein